MLDQEVSWTVARRENDPVAKALKHARNLSPDIFWLRADAMALNIS
jgi:hypothetical protein